MRLALHALFCNDRDFTDEGVRRRAQIENDLRNNERSAEFFRKLRLAVSDPDLKAPEIFSPDAYPDPNDVAEYLDCQLDSSVAAKEYENACLRSQEMLAEVGDCYDALTNKLPLQIDPPKNCRRRLYAVGLQEPDPVVEKIPSSTPETAPQTEYRWNDEYDGAPSSKFETILDSERFVVEDVDESPALETPKSSVGTKRKAGTKSAKSKEKSKTESSSEPSRVGLGLKSILALFVVLGAGRLTFNLRALNSESPDLSGAANVLVADQSVEPDAPVFESTTSNFAPFSDQLVSTEDEPREGEFVASLPVESTPPELAALPREERAAQPAPRERRDQIDIPETTVDAFSRDGVF